MQELLAVIVTWLAVNFGLPAVHDYPQVQFASPATMLDVRLGAATPESGGSGPKPLAPEGAGHGLHAIYDDRTQTLYLPDGWSPASVTDVSLLVHELVHHLQNAAGTKFACPQAREHDAYRAQAHWLELHGSSLADAFGLDPMTVLLRTKCMY